MGEVCVEYTDNQRHFLRKLTHITWLPVSVGSSNAGPFGLQPLGAYGPAGASGVPNTAPTPNMANTTRTWNN